MSLKDQSLFFSAQFSHPLSTFSNSDDGHVGSGAGGVNCDGVSGDLVMVLVLIW